ncbi:MAG: hypothetical protein FWC78_00920 [Defluviitaleaceae bacterium]|nr:hypothetical protein [Defluviitaleaceae bacterium]
MRKSIDVGGSKIIIDCNEVVNLFLHTLNMYGLLGYHGTQYPLRQDENALAAVDEKIHEVVKQGDRHFSYGDLDIYEPCMGYIVDNKTWQQPLSPENIHMGIPHMDFGAAFQKSWDGFYKGYWHDNHAGLAKLFQECVVAFDFADAAKKMAMAAQSDFQKEIYIFPAAAVAESGLKFRDNVCMGELYAGGDMGFVHEGLHLLLQENWARNDEITQIIAAGNYSDSNYGSWAAKYEQILVVGLDCCIRNLSDQRAERYYQGCGVSNEFGMAYGLIKEYWLGGCKETVNSLMAKIITKTLG